MRTMLENESIGLSDGRTLSYAVYGSPVPRITVIYMHGFPSSRFEGKLWHSACTKHSIRLIAPDRPGSGRSTFQKNRRILDWPADIVELVDQLKVKEFYVLGVSGGGPYALACVKSVPKERLLGATIASGIFPLKFGTEGMMLPSRILFSVAPWATGLTSFLFDNTMHDPTIWPIFVAMTRESFAKSSEGAGWEARLYGSDWEFELDQLYLGDSEVSITLWHGTEDANCPVGMSTKANEAIAGSVLHLKESEGHMSYLFRDADEILLDLIGKQETEEYVTVSGSISG
jgi:pimeloyl-ACP methyl ester carboxylesterase